MTAASSPLLATCADSARARRTAMFLQSLFAQASHAVGGTRWSARTISPPEEVAEFALVLRKRTCPAAHVNIQRLVEKEGVAQDVAQRRGLGAEWPAPGWPPGSAPVRHRRAAER